MTKNYGALSQRGGWPFDQSPRGARSFRPVAHASGVVKSAERSPLRPAASARTGLSREDETRGPQVSELLREIEARFR